MSNFFYCPGCKEIVQGSDPCSCVFNVQGVLDANGILHTAKRVDLGPSAQALADFNAETLRWIAEDPTQRWGGLLVEDLTHWVRYGVTTPAELAEYLDQCAERNAAHDWDDDLEERAKAEAEATRVRRRAEREQVIVSVIARLTS